ncbi:MAG TPA: hypothetical protein VIN60_06775 [Anaerolineales bacterium]
MTLDKPMTTEFDPTALDKMPTIGNSTPAKQVMDYLMTKEGGNLINQDGSVNLPPGVKPARPDQFSLSNNNGDKSIFIKPDNTSSWGPLSESPIQPTKFLFKLADGSGILTTELLYYYDNAGNVKVTPVFFFISSSALSDSNLTRLIKTEFGFDQSYLLLSLPWVGEDQKVAGQQYSPQALLPREILIAQNMQTQREKVAGDIVNNGMISEISTVWWGSFPEGPFTSN